MNDSTKNGAADRFQAGTFQSIEMDVPETASLAFDVFVTTLLKKLERLKDERHAFYNNLRRLNTKWANGGREVLALLGASAFLLTAIAAAMRFAPNDVWFKPGPDADKVVMIFVLLIYAVMGTMTFFEKATDKSTAYFRHVATINAIRDLWTTAQFEFLKELITLKNSADPKSGESAARERIRALADAFCADLNKASAGELTDFRTEFLTSLSELDAAAKKGTDDVTKQLQDAAAAAGKAAAEAKTAAEKAAADARTAAKAAEDAAKPGFLNLAVVGDFDDEVIIFIDGAEKVRSRAKTIVVERITPGPRTIAVHSKKGTKELAASVAVDVKPGIQDVKITLS